MTHFTRTGDGVSAGSSGLWLRRRGTTRRGSGSNGPPGAAKQAATTSRFQLTPITVGVIPIVDAASSYLGVQEGFFEEQGLEVSLETAQGGAASVPSVVSGRPRWQDGHGEHAEQHRRAVQERGRSHTGGTVPAGIT
jgi:hypothetical protein